MSSVIHTLLPLFLHLFCTEAVALFLGNTLDASGCAAITAALVLPVFILWYRKSLSNQTEDEVTLRKTGRVCSFRHGPCGNALGLGVRFLLYALAGGLLNVAFSSLLILLGITSLFSNETQEALLTSALFWQLLGPGLLVPFAEELLFRGLVYERMKRAVGLRVSQSVVLSSVLFALYHGNPIQMLYALPMGAMLALVYETQGLGACVALHLGANLVAIVL